MLNKETQVSNEYFLLENENRSRMTDAIQRNSNQKSREERQKPC